jgi:hypothetical protein
MRSNRYNDHDNNNNINDIDDDAYNSKFYNDNINHDSSTYDDKYDRNKNYNEEDRILAKMDSMEKLSTVDNTDEFSNEIVEREEEEFDLLGMYVFVYV